MNSKFYSFTERVLEGLFPSPDEIEFPYDLSKEEIEIVKLENSAAFILGRSGTGKATCLLFKLLCRNIASKIKQTPVNTVFLLKGRDYLQRLMDSQLETQPMRTETQHRAPTGYMLQEAKDPLENETLDTLSDDKFPLVCTFDQLFSFLERVIKLNDRNNFDFPWGYGLGGTPWERRVRRLVDYNVYSTQYWKRCFQNHKDGLEPDLVLAEILGVIKGSTSVERVFKPLSRDGLRGIKDRSGHLETDRVTHLLKSLEKDPHLKTRVQTLFDEVYVDEVQDNKLLERDLLFTLVRNPYGIHFAGDTAQCISRDNMFRFEDIKTRFYEYFISLAKRNGKPDCAKPELKKLSKNYRFYQSIL